MHVTRLALGEGLVGTIAEEGAILNLDEAASHPEFAYRPETGEEMFHSFAGVPIIRRERAIGVLAVQHADPRGYDDVEIEALQTVAMVLSELIANAGLADRRARAGDEGRDAGMARLAGLQAGHRHGARASPSSTSRGSLIEHTVAEDTEAERAPRLFRLRQDARADRHDDAPGRVRHRRRASGDARDLQDVRL